MIDSYAFGFFSPAMQMRIIEQAKREKEEIYKELLKTRVPRKWEDTKLTYEKHMLIDGSSYKPHSLWSPKPVPIGKTQPKEGHFERVGTNLYYIHMLWEPGAALETISGNRRGLAYVTERVEIPGLVRACTNDWQMWMSLTPMEILTQRAGYLKATGTVLVGGLGLGWFLRRVCEKKSVQRVILVEKDKEIFDTIRPRLLELFPEAMKKVSDWILGDALEHVGKHGDDVRHLLDIWPKYNHYDRRFEELKKQVKHLWGWGASSL